MVSDFTQSLQDLFGGHGPVADPDAAGIVDCNADCGGGSVAGDFRDGLGAEGSELVVHVDQLHLEVLGGLADHRDTVVGHVGRKTASVLVQFHILVEGMAYGLHDGSVHLTLGYLRVDRCSGILQGIELLDLDLSRAHVDRNLGEMGTVRH